MCLIQVYLILVWSLALIEEHEIPEPQTPKKRDLEEMTGGSSSSSSYPDWFSCDSNNPLVKASDYIYKGLQLQNENQYEEAIKCFTRAIEMQPSESAYYKLRGVCYLEMENILAKEDFTKVGELEVKSDDERLTFSRTLFGVNLFNEAIQEIMILGNRDELVNLAVRLTTKAEYKKALFCLEVAITENPSVPKYYRERAKCYTKVRSFHHALEDFRTLLTLEPDNPENRLTAILTARKYDDIPEGITGVLNDREFGILGDEFYAQRKYEDAIRCYEKAINEYVFEERYYRQQGRCYMEMGNIKAAISFFWKSAQLDPNAEMNRDLLKQALLSLEEYDEASLDSIQVLSEEEIRMLGNAFFGRWNYEAAIRCFTDAIKKNPTEMNYYKMRGISYLETQKPATAIENFRRVIELDPSQASNIWKFLADALFVDRFKEILQEFLDQLNNDELESLGKELFSEKKFTEAIRCFTIGIQKYPRNLNYYKMRGLCYTEVQAFDMAALDYFHVIQSDAQNEDDRTLLRLTLLNIQTFDQSTRETLSVFNESELERLGFEFFSKGKFEAASYCCTQLISQDPSNGRHLMQRGTCFMRMDNWTMAISDFTKLLEIEPNNRNYRMSVRNALTRYLLKFFSFRDGQRLKIYSILEYWKSLNGGSDISTGGSAPLDFLTILKNNVNVMCDYLFEDVLDIIPLTELSYFGDQFFSRTQLDDALRCYNAALNRNPMQAQYYKKRGNYYLAKKNSVMAAVDFGKATQLEPENRTNIDLLTRTLQGAENLMAIPEETLMILSENELVSLAYDFFSRDKFQNAIRCYSTTIRKNPTFAEYYRMRANCHLKNNHPLLAMWDFRKALEIDPQRTDDRLTLSGLCFDTTNYGEAVQEMILAQANHIQVAKLANKLMAIGKLEEAITCFTEAIRQSPSTVLYYKGRGSSYFKTNQIQKAIEDWKIVVHLNPTLDHRVDLTRALIRDKKFEEAKIVIRMSHPQYHSSVPFLLREINDIETTEKRLYLIELIHRDAQRQFDKLFKESWFSGLQEESHHQLNRILEHRDIQMRNLTDAYAEFNLLETRSRTPPVRVVGQPVDPSLIASTSRTPPPDPSRTDTPTPPEYLLDKISLELINDPTVAPSGITYDRGPLMISLEYSLIDPSTREYLHPDQLRPNLALREAIRLWKAKHNKR